MTEGTKVQISIEEYISTLPVVQAPLTKDEAFDLLNQTASDMLVLARKEAQIKEKLAKELNLVQDELQAKRQIAESLARTYIPMTNKQSFKSTSNVEFKLRDEPSKFRKAGSGKALEEQQIAFFKEHSPNLVREEKIVREWVTADDAKAFFEEKEILPPGYELSEAQTSFLITMPKLL